jgi:hypothetical protein
MTIRFDPRGDGGFDKGGLCQRCQMGRCREVWAKFDSEKFDYEALCEWADAVGADIEDDPPKSPDCERPRD